MYLDTSAPAKTILLGEHAVVYGLPAVAVPINKLRARAYIENSSSSGLTIVAEDINQVISVKSLMYSKNDDEINPLEKLAVDTINQLSASLPNVTIRIISDIPIASGMGSGAAVSTALGRAIAKVTGKAISNELLNKLVYEVEKLHHGTPSGIDNNVIVYESPIIFTQRSQIKKLPVHTPFHLLIADTGIAGLTRESVMAVRSLYDTNTDYIQDILDRIGNTVRRAVESIESGQLINLGRLLTMNHEYLQQLTVSSPELDLLVSEALKAGALGAKLIGGGRGGNMIALVESSDIEKIRTCLLHAGALNVIHSIVR